MPVFPARTPSLPCSDSDAEAGEGSLDDEGGDALVPLRAIDAGEDEEVIGGVAQADPDLRAVEDVAIAVAARRAGQLAGVGADARLGEAERRQLLAARLRHEVLLLLLLGPPLQERQRVEPGVDARG